MFIGKENLILLWYILFNSNKEYFELNDKIKNSKLDFLIKNSYVKLTSSNVYSYKEIPSINRHRFYRISCKGIFYLILSCIVSIIFFIVPAIIVDKFLKFIQ